MFSVELSPTVTLDYPSIAALASHIAAQLPQVAGATGDFDEEIQVHSHVAALRALPLRHDTRDQHA